MPTALIIILCVLAGVTLLLFARVHLTVTYKTRVRVTARYLFLLFALFPKKVRWRRYTAKREQKAAAKAKKHKKEHKGEGKREEKTPFTLRENLQLVRALSAVLVRRCGKHLRLHAARIHLYVATGDAATTAIAYGAVSASLAYLIAALEKVMKVRARRGDVSVVADYLSETPRADVKLHFSIPLGSALALLIALALAYLKKRRAQRAAKGASTEKAEKANEKIGAAPEKAALPAKEPKTANAPAENLPKTDA